MGAERSTLHILVVAEYADLCEAAVAALEEAGETAVSSTSADEAVQRLHSEPFDVALIEEVPPHFGTFVTVRVEATRRGIPWVAMATTRVPPGAAAILRMPFSDVELVRVVRSVTHHRPVRP
jgi:CheY-like chemotaxis protein